MVNSNKRSSEVRRMLVARADKERSNRALAKELEVTEGTIRRDREYLATPADLRPKGRAPRSVTRVAKRPYNPKNIQRHHLLMLSSAQQWLKRQPLTVADVEHVVHGAGKELWIHGPTIAHFPPPEESPAALWIATIPPYKAEDYMPAMLNFCTEWLARWLARCLPGQEEAQDEMLREISAFAKERDSTMAEALAGKQKADRQQDVEETREWATKRDERMAIWMARERRWAREQELAADQARQR
jgi:hypothetical protein